MEPYRMFEAEYKFASLVWASEPINSTDLVKRSAEVLGWKKSTTYTVLRKLCERGILRNETAVVTAIVKQADAQRLESEALIDKNFNGSLPQFVAAFLDNKKLSSLEVAELKRIIEEAES